MACADLAEAEGRALRASVVRVARLLLVLGAAWMCGLVGVALLVGALFFALAPLIGVAGTLLVCGAVSLVIAGGALWSVRKELR